MLRRSFTVASRLVPLQDPESGASDHEGVDAGWAVGRAHLKVI